MAVNSNWHLKEGMASLTRQRLARGRRKKKKINPRSPASRGRRQRPWLATGDRRIDHWVSQKGGRGRALSIDHWFQGGIPSSGELARRSHIRPLASDLSLCGQTPEQITSLLCPSENRKGNRSTWAWRGNSAICSDNCITVQSQVWTEPSLLHQCDSLRRRLEESREKIQGADDSAPESGGTREEILGILAYISRRWDPVQSNNMSFLFAKQKSPASPSNTLSLHLYFC
ncbi:hypothetical protein TIFTF001_041395 [Ficus carica]|uniref:Uncharacterized protein n=1 Tax=Ficus carica TaxID=3494 RepID=A0AA87ZE57_FICCA|nr:hypothetical protein TIFTF001_041395 [Ficus carica]